MKRKINRLSFAICLLATFIFSNRATAQKLPPEEMSSLQWMEKSDRQRNTAWTLVGAGAVLTVLGFVIGVGKSEVEDPASGLQGVKSETKAGTYLAIAGGATMLTSIPFFIGAKKSKQKGLSVAMTLPLAPRMTATLPQRRRYAAIQFTLPIGR